MLESFDGCALKMTASRLVFADGVPDGKLMLVGEAPGAEEDRQGKPFVGRAGQLLDRMLAAIGLDRSKVYIANIVPWRPPGNRTPTPQESAICLPFITRQIELVDPDVLMFLGGFAAASLTGTKDGILKIRGRWLSFHVGNRDIRAMATLHPAYLLRQPLQKRLAWRDFLAVKRALDEAAATAAG
ncbi:MAG: uracil-DNA glycosylase [Blastochloris sp.]|nr:uracil-DNA glycosylase [Blastochloris sp.]